MKCTSETLYLASNQIGFHFSSVLWLKKAKTQSVCVCACALLTEFCGQSLAVLCGHLSVLLQVHLVGHQHHLSVAPRVRLDLRCPDKHQHNAFSHTALLRTDLLIDTELMSTLFFLNWLGHWVIFKYMSLGWQSIIYPHLKEIARQIDQRS